MPSRGPRSNRIDTLTPQPPTAVPGQDYGQATEEIAAQKQIPMAGAPTLQGAQQSPQTQPGGAPAGGPNDLLAMALAHNGPGDSMRIDRPTERPNEPVTAGIPGGPGPGPEALSGVGALARENVMGQATLGQLLSNLAARPGAPSAVQNLAALAQGGVQ